MKAILLLLVVSTFTSYARNVFIPELNLNDLSRNIIMSDGDKDGGISVADPLRTGKINLYDKDIISSHEDVYEFTIVKGVNCNRDNLVLAPSSNALTFFYGKNKQVKSLNVADGFNSVYASTNINVNSSDRKPETVKKITDDISTHAPNDPVIFSDANFEAELFLGVHTGIDDDGDGTITYAEAGAYFGNIIVNNKGITDFTGIEAFTIIQNIKCNNNNLTTLDVSACVALQTLECNGNANLTTLDVSGCVALASLHCNGNANLTTLDVSSCVALTELNCTGNNLAALDVTKNTALINLFGNSNQLTALDVTKNTSLKFLYCSNNQLTALDVSNNTDLTNLNAKENDLYHLNLNLTNCVINQMNVRSNNLTCIKTASGTASGTGLWLIDPGAGYNTTCTVPVTSITVQGQGGVSTITSSGGSLQMEKTVATPQASVNTVTWSLTGGAALASIDPVTGVLTAVGNGTVEVTASATDSSGVTGKKNITITGQPGACTSVVSIPDLIFKAALIAHGGTITGAGIGVIDTNGDGQICATEALAYTGTIDVSDKSIVSLSGIEAFTKITKLNCNKNQLTILDVSSNTLLTKLSCFRNSLSELNLTSNTALIDLKCGENQLNVLDVSNTALTNLNCKKNQLTKLKLGNTALTNLNCLDNNLITLDLRGKPGLITFDATINPTLICIRVSDLTALFSTWVIDGTTATYTEASCLVSVTSITIQGKLGVSTITTNLGTLQMEVKEMLPSTATEKDVTWSISNGGAFATIDPITGVLTARSNGTVEVTATATDGSGVKGKTDIEISGQTLVSVLVTSITIQGKLGVSTITTKLGTLQMEVKEILPSSAIEKGIIWSISNGAEFASIDEVTGVLTAKANGKVEVKATATDGSGVTGQTDVEITTEVKILSSTIPKGFTPNGDAENDTWVITSNYSNYSKIKAQIFNRWGEKVYETNNYQDEPWDGSEKGSGVKVPVGSYFYIIDFNEKAGEPKQGLVYVNY